MHRQSAAPLGFIFPSTLGKVLRPLLLQMPLARECAQHHGSHTGAASAQSTTVYLEVDAIPAHSRPERDPRLFWRPSRVRQRVCAEGGGDHHGMYWLTQRKPSP